MINEGQFETAAKTAIINTNFRSIRHNVASNTHQGSGHKFDIIQMNIQHSHTFDVSLKDDNNNFPNKDYIQPYITAYCWKRTA